jgi:cytochrome P450
MTMTTEASACPVRFQEAPVTRDRGEGWAYMRSGGDVFLSDDGAWYVTSPEACQYVARHPELFSSSINAGFTNCPVLHIPASIDPPEHSRYRKIIDPMFSPRVMDTMEGDMRRRVNLYIDKFIDSGRCEVMDDLADPYATEVFAVAFGLPLKDVPMVTKWTHETMAGAADQATIDAGREAGEKMAAYLTDLIQDLRSAKGEDVLSRIIADAGLSDDELVGLAFNVLQGGLDTVPSTIGFMLKHLAEQPDLRRAVIADPDLVGPFIEELVRLETVAAFMVRNTTQDVEIGGTTIPAGSVVRLGYAAANRDPETFSKPDEFDLTQGRTSHYGFGSANHRCLGSHLARRELRVVFEEFHRRIPEYSLEPGVEPLVVWPANLLRLDAVPLVFAPGGGA